MIWTILGIEETKDKNAIKKAYRNKLRTVNPEEKQEEFMALRKAYEEAMRLADLEEEAETEKTPEMLWVAEAAKVYANFRKRIDPECWKELLSSDVCKGLDTRPLAEEALLHFMMNKYYLPHEVFAYLNDEFSWTERTAELYEKYPSDFIDYVILDGVAEKEMPPLEMFVPGVNGEAIDSYIRDYHTLNRQPFMESAEEVKRLKACEESHPYGDILIGRYDDFIGDPEAVTRVAETAAQYPDNLYIQTQLIWLYDYKQMFEELEKAALHVLELNPKAFAGKECLAKAYAGQGKYKEATETVNDAMGLCDGNQKLINELNEFRIKWNEELIGKYENDLKTDPDNMNIKYELAWCYLQNDRLEAAEKYAVEITEGYPEAFGYYNMMSFLRSSQAKWEEALSYTLKLLEAAKQLKEDGTEKTAKRIARIGEIYSRCAAMYSELGRKEEAEVMNEEALQHSENSIELLTTLAFSRMHTKEYAKAAELAEKIVAMNSSMSQAYVLLASAYFELNKDNLAFNAVNKALELDPSELFSYLIKLRILVRNGAYEPAEELISFLRENGITQELTINYCEALMKHERDKDAEEALKLFEDTEKKIQESEEKPLWTADFYYDMALVKAEVKDKGQDYDREDLYQLLDRGLKQDPDNFGCMDYKAWLLKKDNRNEESLNLYKILEQRESHTLNIEMNIAELYYRNVREMAPEALKYYTILLEAKESADMHFYAGMCCFYMNDLKNAELHFRREKEMAPDDIDGYYRLAQVLMVQAGDYLKEALENALQTADLAEKREGDTVRFFTPLITIYRKMGRPEDAVKAVFRKKDANPDDLISEELFDIYCQFGMWKEAENVLTNWKKMKDSSGAEKAQGRLAVFRQQFIKASLVPNAAKYHPTRRTLAMHKGDLKKYLADSKEALDEARNKKTDWNGFDWMQYAFALYLNKMYEDAHAAAQTALAKLETCAAEYITDRANYLGRSALCLAILGRFDEAEERLAQVRKMPHCLYCNYCTCKDADIYEVYTEIIKGNMDKVMQMSLEFQKIWPDEEDFIQAEWYVRTKGRK